MKLAIIVLGCLTLGAIMFVLRSRKANSPIGKPCSVCGAPSSYGYSEHPEEDADKIKPLCLAHLVPQLETGYRSFQGRAVVIEPADGPPCYIFQPAGAWRKAFKDTKIADDASALLAKMNLTCRDCGEKAPYLWLGSNGLTGRNFGETLEKGLTATLLAQNAAPVSLCPGCCVKRIKTTFAAKHLSYLEVCVPKGSTEGFVIPMGY
jgi:hypothetical protein